MKMFQKTIGFRIFFWVFLVLIGAFVFLPLLWMINTALKPSSDTFTLTFFTGPKTLENILNIIRDPTIMGYLRNSLLVSFASSFMATIVCAFAGYSFSKFRYRGRKFIMGLFMMSQAFPQAILLLSIYVLMQRTGAMPEDTFMLDWGQCARNTPCSFIRARSSSPLQMQWAITVGHSPPKRPGRL